MPNFRDRYGLSGTEIGNLNRRWHRIKKDCTWETFDDFVLWCAQTDYKPRMQLVKRLKSLPHGPNNSVFLELSEIMKLQQARYTKQQEITAESRFCKGCLRVCPPCGCADWKKWYIQNLDSRIHKNIPKKTVVDFRYEHPDLVREGIVFDPSR